MSLLGGALDHVLIEGSTGLCPSWEEHCTMSLLGGALDHVLAGRSIPHVLYLSFPEAFLVS